MNQVKHEAIATEALALVKDTGQLSLAALKELAIIGAKFGIGVPLVAGAALGYATSKITSPSIEDVRATEKRLELARMKTMMKEHRRKTELEARKAENGGLA
jgi:hypothetical protein